MMTATEQIEARKQQEAEPDSKPAPPFTDVKPEQVANVTTVKEPVAKSTSAAATSSSRDPNSVTLTLDPHVYAHFAEKAKADDRTISKYIARHLRGFVDEIKGKF